MADAGFAVRRALESAAVDMVVSWEVQDRLLSSYIAVGWGGGV